MYEDYRFLFDINKVERRQETDSYIVYVSTRILDDDQADYFEGIVRVDLNLIGIFPMPSDIARAVEPKDLRRKLGMEIKRYMKPQKRFLYELAK